MKITLPVFLGKAIDEDGYFFLAIEKGLARFIKCSSTGEKIFWCYSTSLPDFLDLGEVPESILNKVVNFVGGPVEITTLVVPTKRNKRDLAVIPISQEVYGEPNVISDIPEQASNWTKEATACNSSDTSASSTSAKQRRVSRSKDSVTSATQSKGSTSQEGVGSRFETDSIVGTGDLGRLPGSRGSRTGCSDATCESLSGRVLEHGVLGDGRTEVSTLHGHPSSNELPNSGLDGTCEPGIRVKRKRRTKAEMELARNEQAKAI